ncbi:MAG: hypothetical protein ACLFVU_06540 [Phycisphaerae bacterium]
MQRHYSELTEILNREVMEAIATIARSGEDPGDPRSGGAGHHTRADWRFSLVLDASFQSRSGSASI